MEAVQDLLNELNNLLRVGMSFNIRQHRFLALGVLPLHIVRLLCILRPIQFETFRAVRVHEHETQTYTYTHSHSHMHTQPAESHASLLDLTMYYTRRKLGSKRSLRTGNVYYDYVARSQAGHSRPPVPQPS
jgi:hypothetical protein